MYIATQDIKSPRYGLIKKGDEAPHIEAWIEAGLIEEGSKKEVKPEPKAKKETKPKAAE